jgi:aminoglycoside phosphotransferase (APT) family kinase protein
MIDPTNPRTRAAAISNFVAGTLGRAPTRVARLHAFATNEVYEVDVDRHRFVVKASSHDASRAEAWACSQGARAGCGAPAVLAFGTLDERTSAFVTAYVAGKPMPPAHPTLRDLGAMLRRLHRVTTSGFGWLAQATWQADGRPVLEHDAWLGFLNAVCAAGRDLSRGYPTAASVAAAARAAIDVHADALACIAAGVLCHGDLKAAHVLVDTGAVAGVIDWGDAVIADPIWDIARFAQRLDARSLALLLEGYDPDGALTEACASRLPLYDALWHVVDAVVDDRLGVPADTALAAAMACLRR